MASVYERNGKWRATVRVNGVSKSKSFDVEWKALRWAEELEHDLSSHGNLLLGRTVKDALDRYGLEVSPTKKGERWEKIRIEKFKALPWASKMMTDLTTDDLQNWIDHSKVSAGTILRDLSLLRAVFERARKKWKWIKSNPVKDLDKPKRPAARDRRISDKEMQDVLSSLKYSPDASFRGAMWEAGHAFQIAIETAMRRGEIWSLDWKDVDLKRRFVRLHRTKNGTVRDVPLSLRAVELFELLNPMEQGPIFKTRAESAEAVFRKQLKSADIKDLHFHDTRHEAITRLAKKVDVLDLARIVGHKDLRSLMDYYNETAEEIASKLD